MSPIALNLILELGAIGLGTIIVLVIGLTIAHPDRP